MAKPSIPQYIQAKADELLQQLADGLHWSLLGGRKLIASDLRVVFELPAAYRLVCWYEGNTLSRFEAMSHQKYDTVAGNTRR